MIGDLGVGVGGGHVVPTVIGLAPFCWGVGGLGLAPVCSSGGGAVNGVFVVGDVWKLACVVLVVASVQEHIFLGTSDCDCSSNLIH